MISCCVLKCGRNTTNLMSQDCIELSFSLKFINSIDITSDNNYTKVKSWITLIMFCQCNASGSHKMCTIISKVVNDKLYMVWIVLLLPKTCKSDVPHCGCE